MGISWKSKRKYRTPKGFGHIVQMGKCFMLENVHGKFAVDQAFARSVQAQEAFYGTRGRPLTFSESTEMHALTLPTRLWRALGEEYHRSYKVAEILDEYFSNRKGE